MSAPKYIPAALLLAIVAASATPTTGRGVYAISGTPVTLRYTFTPGEILTYQQTLTETARTIVAGKTVDTGTATEDYQARVIVRAVTPGGAALMSVTFGQAHTVIVHNGKVTRDAPAGATLSSPTDACYQEVSGTQYCSYRGAFGQNDIGQVSPDPVTVGESWMSRIDNTWAVDTRDPVYLHNTLRALSTGPTGPVAALTTTGTVRGTTGAREGEKITGALHGRIDGTWRFAVDTGVFTDEDLRQTIDVTGTMRVSRKTRAATTHQVSRTTMQLLSIRAGQAQPFQAPGRSKTYRDATLGFSIAYPATWQAQPLASGGFEAATSDGNAAMVIGRYPEAQFGSPTDAASLPSLVRRFGEPVDPIVLGKATMHGHEVRVVDTVLVNRDHVELQCEAQAIATTRGGYYLISLVALGPPVWAQRLQHAAWLIEDMQRMLATMTIFPQRHTLY